MLIRLTRQQLFTLKLHHLESEVDLSVAVPEGLGGERAEMITGYTEWYAQSGESIGWDWGVVGNMIVVLSSAEIRTNIGLVDERSYDEDPTLSKIHLLEFIETLPWRAEVKKIIDRDHPGLPRLA